MKYIKKPIPIDALQWTGHNTDEIINFMAKNNPVFDAQNNIIIKTLEGEMRACPGSWIIKGVEGEYYPCRGDIFAQTYEPYEEKEEVIKLLCPFCELHSDIKGAPKIVYDAVHNVYKRWVTCPHCGKKVNYDDN